MMAVHHKARLGYLDLKLGGLPSALRDRGEFLGELGETILFTPYSSKAQ